MKNSSINKAWVVFVLLTVLLTFVAFPNAWGQSAGTGRTEVVKLRSLQIDAEARPGIGQFAPADDVAQHLVYELYITNWNPRELRFAAIEVQDAATGQRLARFDRQALEDPIRIDTARHPGQGPGNRILRPSQTACATIEVKLPLGASLPAAVRHRIEFESDPANLQLIREDGSLSSELVSFSEPLPIDRRLPLVIDAPLRGGPWVCSNGLGFGNNHETRGASNNIARLHVPQRFGCDFAKVDAHGNALPDSSPDIVNASMFYGYGADVIAVADGRVVKTQDGIPENVPQAGRGFAMPVPLTSKTTTGNMIALQIGERQYAFYAHLQPGSLRVKEGDRIRKGQLLAKLGNSGNSSGPHLHFQVSSGPKLNGYDFVPHLYRSYWLSGYGEPKPVRRRKIEFKVPTDHSVMTFPGPGYEGGVVATPASAVSSAEVPTSYPFHDSFTRHYELEPSPRIEIRGIGGPVVISSVPSQTADVQVQRSAATQRELDCHETRIDQSPDLITIMNVQFTDRPGCGSIRASQAVTLQVPSDTVLRVSNIDGELRVTGPVKGIIAESINDHVTIAAAGTVELRSLANGVSLSLGAAAPGSAIIESVAGNVELAVAGQQNVEIRVSGLNGKIAALPPGFSSLRRGKVYLLKSGEGGTTVSINGVDGNIVVRRQ